MAYQYETNLVGSMTMKRQAEAKTDTFRGISPTVTADTLISGVEQFLNVVGRSGDGVYYDYTDENSFRTVRQNVTEV